MQVAGCSTARAVDLLAQLRRRSLLSASPCQSWPIWIYPWPEDQGSWCVFSLHLGDQGLSGREAGRALHGNGQPGVALVTVWDAEVLRYVQGGGRALFWQQGAGPLPARRGPFWREALKLFPAHPVWSVFPVKGYADMQFFGLATDIMLDSSGLPQALAAANVKAVRPVLRRLDARSFEMSDYILEAEIGAGRLTTLRFQNKGHSSRLAKCGM
jgi:hypothetical protein